MCYFYAPRGFTMDFKNKEVLTEFTKYLKEYFVERGFDVIVEREDNDWCRLVIRWMD